MYARQRGSSYVAAALQPTQLSTRAASNIDLCTAHEATSRKWALELRIPLLWVESTVEFSLNLSLRPKQSNAQPIEIDPDAGKWLLSRDGGVTVQSISELLCAYWDTPDMPRAPGARHRLEVPCDGMELRFGDAYWCPLESFAFIYAIHDHGWKGAFTFAQCRGILNVTTGILRAKVGLTEKDIPIQRDPAWMPVEDVAADEAANVNLLRIERSTPTPISLPLDHMAFSREA